MLPTEKRKPIGDLSQEIILAYGSPKIGKSTFCSHFPDALFLSTEPGLNHLEVFECPVGNWQAFVEAVRDIEASPTKFKTIIVDTIDNLYLFCRDYMNKVNGVKHESDMDWGRGWSDIDGEFRRQITRLTQIRTVGVCFVSHSEEKEIKKRGAKESEFKIAHTLPNRARKVINPLADMILYMSLDEKGERVIHTKETVEYEAGDRTGRLPDILPLDYKAFLLAYYGSNGDESAAREKLVAQIQQGLQYLSENKIDAFDTAQRVKNSAEKHLGTSNMAEASITDLQSYLQHLRAKARNTPKEGVKK